VIRNFLWPIDQLFSPKVWILKTIVYEGDLTLFRLLSLRATKNFDINHFYIPSSRASEGKILIEFGQKIRSLGIKIANLLSM